MSFAPTSFAASPAPTSLTELGGENFIRFCELGDRGHKARIDHGQFGVVCYQFHHYALVSCGGQCQDMEVLVQLLTLGFS
jgi:hypothetical protein